MSKQEEIIEVCGKKVVVRYVEHLSPCPRCVFYGEGCTCSEHCLKFDKGNGTGPYFVDAERQEEKDYKRLYEELVNSEWYKKYYQGASVGDSVAMEQPKADLDAEFERFLDDVEGVPRMYHCDEQIEWGKDIARHFAEWERKRTLDKVIEWMKKNLTYIHPRKGVETCMVNIPAFLDAMNEENT